MQKTNQWKVTMVNCKRLTSKNRPGFKTPKGVQQFCTRYHVNCFWWQPPQGNKKIFMVDYQDFRRCFNQYWTMTKNTTAKTKTKTKFSTHHTVGTKTKGTWKSTTKKAKHTPKTYTTKTYSPKTYTSKTYKPKTYNSKTYMSKTYATKSHGTKTSPKTKHFASKTKGKSFFSSKAKMHGPKKTYRPTRTGYRRAA